MSKSRRSLGPSLEEAEVLGAHALAFLAEDAPRMARFLALTGGTLAEVRRNAHSRELLAAVLEHLASDESLLLTFAASTHVDAGSVLPAAGRLRGPRG